MTGNNLEFQKDMPRRVLSARIEVTEENPDMRSGFDIPDLKQYCQDNRETLVGYALTILASYAKAGRPSQNLVPYGSFERWSDEIRSAIVWAGLPDPCETRKEIAASDPERESTRALFEQWFECFEDKEIHVNKLIEAAEVKEVIDQNGENTIVWLNPNLRCALLEVASAKGHSDKMDAKRLGWWCRGHKDRPVTSDGKTYQLKRCKGDRVGITWQIVCSPIISGAE